MEKKIECINFDLDSVLYIHSEFLETALVMCIKTMIQMGLKADISQALEKLIDIRNLDSNAKDHFDQLCFHFNKVYDPLIIAAGVERYWDCKIGVMTTAPENNLILSTFFKTYPLTIVSNGPPIKQAGKLVRLGLSPFFSQHDADLNVQKHLFYCTAQKDREKPYPYLWLESQKDIGYQFSRAVMVGDRYWDDIFGAKRLGMIAVKVNQGPYRLETITEVFNREWQSDKNRAFFSQYHSEKEIMTLMEPDYAIDSLNELQQVVTEIERKL